MLSDMRDFNRVTIYFSGEGVKFTILSFIIVIFLFFLTSIGSGVFASELAHERSETSSYEVYEQQVDPDLEVGLAYYKKRFEAAKKAEKGHAIKKVIAIFFIGTCALAMLVKWLSFFGPNDWHVPRAVWALLGFTGAVYFGVAAYYDMSQDYIGAASRSGFSLVSRRDQAFLFYLTISTKLLSSVFLFVLSFKYLFGKRK